jgi:hypothetical protein
MPGTCHLPLAFIGDSLIPLCSGLARGLFTGTLNPPPRRSSTGFTLRISGELLAAMRNTAGYGLIYGVRRCHLILSRERGTNGGSESDHFNGNRRQA